MSKSPATVIDRLAAIMARLRDPERGCAWDVAQDFASIAPYTVEEAGEVPPMRSSGGIWRRCATNWAILRCRSFSIREWRRKPGISRWPMCLTAFRTRWNAAIRMSFGDGADGHEGWEAIKAVERSNGGLEGALAGVALRSRH